jgi:hypothetical protein
MDRLAEPEPEPEPEPVGRLIGDVPRRAQMAGFAQDEPDEARAILGLAQSLRRPTGRREPVLRSAGFIGRATEDPHR